MVEFADELSPLGGDYEAWAAAHRKAPIWLAEVELAATSRLVGVFVTPATEVLGLRAWDDADEGADPAPWVLFDVEKLIRMALHQSGLAFEALTSATSWGSFPAREIAQASVTSGILQYYRDVTTPLADGKTEQWRWRTLLTGALLTRGIVSQSLPWLCDELQVASRFNQADFATLRALLDGPSPLPGRPTDYDFVNDLIVRLRLEGE